MQPVQPLLMRVGQVGARAAVAEHGALAEHVDEDDDGARAAGPLHHHLGTLRHQRVGEDVTGGVVADLPDEARSTAGMGNAG